MTPAAVRGAGLEEARGLWSGAGVPARTSLETIAVADALGEVLAAPLTALVASPPAPVSAMDGLAVSAAETEGEPSTLPSGRYARIDTGEPIPAPFDAVVMIERVELEGDGSARILERVSAGQNIRAEGEHVAKGQQVVPAGRVLGPYDIAAAIAGGHARLEVHRRPRVAVLATGNELRAAGMPLAAGEVHDGNGPMIAAQIVIAGGTVERPPLLGDDVDRIAAHLSQQAAVCDLVLLLGGSSRGRRDCARAAIERSGRVLVEGVAIRPGHPTILGVVDETPVMGVPGYPLAAAVAVHLLAVRLVQSLRGLNDQRPRGQVELAEEVGGRPDAVCVVPLRVDSQTLRAHPLSRRGSNIAGLAAADALLCLAPGESRRAGETVNVERLRRR
jgi:putative molybdopterin biosynthesis protein